MRSPRREAYSLWDYPVSQHRAITTAETYAFGITQAASVSALLAANDLSDVANAGTARENIHVPALAACQAVAVTNVSLSAPGSTFGGFTLTNSGTDQVLLTAQPRPARTGRGYGTAPAPP